MATRPRGRPTADDPSVVSTDAVLDAALEAFAERGYEGTSVREIARGLGVSHNLIPQRIGSKDVLWYAAVDRAFGVLAGALDDALDERDPDDDRDLERLRALVVRFIAANAQRPALLRVINQEAADPGPRLDHLFEHYIEPVRRFGEEVLADLARRGEVRPVSVSLFYFLLTHGAGGPLAFPDLAERLGTGVDPDDPAAVRRHAEAAADLLFDGIRTSPTQY